MKYFIKYLLSIALLSSPMVNFADEVSKENDCSHDILISFFPETFVKNTLKKFNIPENKWDLIIKQLDQKDDFIVSSVEEQAKKMDPNPLRDPNLRSEAVTIFRSTLIQVFTRVMKSSGFSDLDNIQEMLDDIQKQKAKHFAHCMEKVLKPETKDKD